MTTATRSRGQQPTACMLMYAEHDIVKDNLFVGLSVTRGYCIKKNATHIVTLVEA